MFIRDVRTTDAQRLTEIYSYYVEDTAVSFEYKAPTVQEFGNRIEKISRKYPYLVCEDEGRITGYVYASAYSTREAYDWTVATSIYVDRAYRRKGVGKALYAALEERLKEQDLKMFISSLPSLQEPVQHRITYRLRLKPIIRSTEYHSALRSRPE